MSYAALPAAPVWTVAAVAEPTPPPVPKPADPGGQGEDFGKSSPLGFLVLVLLLIAVVFLARSMSKHLKRVPASFDDPEPEPGTPDATDAVAPKPEPDPGSGTEPAAEGKHDKADQG